MSEMLYWGNGGQYGPFEAQVDGWPNAGQVMRYFRQTVKKLTAEEVGMLYGNAIRGQPINGRWIQQMEEENTVPTDITRRRVLAEILGIPPLLFGLSAFDDVLFQSAPKSISIDALPRVPKYTQIATSIVTNHQKNLPLYWRLDNTNTAEDALKDIYLSIQELDELVYQVHGNLKTKVQELLFSYYRLATTILIDKKKCARAFSYAHKMVELASEMENKELLATSQHTRGFVNLLWGMGEPGVTEVDYEKIRRALNDFETASPFAHAQLKGIVLTDMGRAQALLKSSATDIAIAQRTMDQAGKMVGRGDTDDLYTSILLGEPLRAFNKGRYHIGKAVVLTSLGRGNKALEELQYGEEGTSRAQVRRHAWINVTRAEAFMGMKEYANATDYAKDAFVVCKAINSVGNIAAIKAIYRDLLESPYRNSLDVKELGLMIAKY